MNPIFAIVSISFFMMAGTGLLVDWMQDAIGPCILHGVLALVVGSTKTNRTRA